MSESSRGELFTSRRRVLQIIAFGGVAGWVWGCGLLRRSVGPVTRTRTLMGTTVSLTVLGEDRDAAEATIDATLDHMAQLESRLSRHRSTSELSQLNAHGRVDGASRSLIELLELAQRINRLGDGAFDVTIHPVLELYRERLFSRQQLPSPEEVEQLLERVDQRSIVIVDGTVRLERPGMAVTLDGIGKGYIVDQGVAVLKQRGLPNVLVEAGGDLVAGGLKAPDTPWRIGIRHPRPGPTRLQARLDASDVAVATSGDYMQPFVPDLSQHHILDPRTGASSPELASSTVIAPTAALADGLATMTMVLGARRSVELLEELPECEGYFVSKQLEVSKTSGFTVSA
jgi:thiamine biosynthesis lipoprotein